MVQLTNTLDTQNLKEHCNGIANKHAGYTESQGTAMVHTHTLDTISRSTAMVQLTNTLDTQNLKEHCNGIAMVHITNTLDTQNLKEHCNGIVNKHPGYTESQGTLQ